MHGRALTQNMFLHFPGIHDIIVALLFHKSVSSTLNYLPACAAASCLRYRFGRQAAGSRADRFPNTGISTYYGIK